MPLILKDFLLEETEKEDHWRPVNPGSPGKWPLHEGVIESDLKCAHHETNWLRRDESHRMSQTGKQ